MIDVAFIQHCAPTVSPVTINAVIRVESAEDPLALHINGLGSVHAKTVAGAVAIVKWAVASGYTVDIGLMGLNTRTLTQFRVSIEDAFDRCTNLRVGGALLTRNYLAALKHFAPGQRALAAALSAYNTGDFGSGWGNGYLAKCFNAARAPADRRRSPSYTIASFGYKAEVSP